MPGRPHGRPLLLHPLILSLVLGCALATTDAIAPRHAHARAASPARASSFDVDADSIASTIRVLSEPSGSLASRYAERPETRLEHAPAILSLFQRYLDSPDTAFLIPFESSRTDTPQVNVMGLVRARSESQGLFLLTAHYDATGKLTQGGWDPFVDPAPGADDNASGVACLVEAARVLPTLALPFDVGLVAFGSEEAYGPATAAPLEGSRLFARALEDSGALLLGVINCDMIAYNPIRKKIDIVSNASSLWIMELIEAAADSLAPDLLVKPILAPLSANSDHASFWAVEEDAVLLIENQFPDRADSLPDGTPLYPKNPHYHTVHDSLGTLNLDLARDVTTAVIGAVERLARVPDGFPDLAVDSSHIIVQQSKVFFGDVVPVEVWVFNEGGLIVSAAAATVELWQGEPGAGEWIGSAAIDLPIASNLHKRVVIPWTVSERASSPALLSARVVAGGIDEALLSNNEAGRSVPLYSDDILRLRAIGTPARISDTDRELRFDFDMALRPGQPQEIDAVVYNAAGRRLATHPIGLAKEGRNSLFWRNFLPLDDHPLSSGVYFIDVRLSDRASGREASRATGKFVLLR